MRRRPRFPDAVLNGSQHGTQAVSLYNPSVTTSMATTGHPQSDHLAAVKTSLPKQASSPAYMPGQPDEHLGLQPRKLPTSLRALEQHSTLHLRQVHLVSAGHVHPSVFPGRSSWTVSTDNHWGQEQLSLCDTVTVLTTFFSDNSIHETQWGQLHL